MKKKVLMLMMAGLFTFSALSLTGCGGSDSGEQKEETAAETTEETEEADTGEAEEETEEADTEDTEDTEESDGGEATSIDPAFFDDCDTFYAGTTDDENTYMYVSFGSYDDGSKFGALMFYDTSTGQSGSWLGDVEEHGNDQYTISDEYNNTSLTFTATEVDGGYQLDMGEDLGTGLVGSVEKDDFVEAATAISEGTEPQF